MSEQVDRLGAIAQWLQQEDEELLYTPDAAVANTDWMQAMQAEFAVMFVEVLEDRLEQLEQAELPWIDIPGPYERAFVASRPLPAVDQAARRQGMAVPRDQRVFLHRASLPLPLRGDLVDEHESITASLPPLCRTTYPVTQCPCGAVTVHWEP